MQKKQANLLVVPFENAVNRILPSFKWKTGGEA